MAQELILAEPGRDDGLLPCNSLLAEVEDAARRHALPAPLGDALALGRQWIDDLLVFGAFDPVSLARLRHWVAWMQRALKAVQAGSELPAPLSTAAAVVAEKDAPVVSSVSPITATEPDEPMVLSLESDGELLREFCTESHEHLQNIELGVLTLEDNPADNATLHSIFRAFHTFKGGSGFLNLRPINRLAHELESLLDLARQHRLTIDSAAINLILAGGDTLKRFVAEIEAQLGGRNPGVPILIPTQDLLRRVTVVVQASAASAFPAEAADAVAVAASAPTVAPMPVHSPGINEAVADLSAVAAEIASQAALPAGPAAITAPAAPEAVFESAPGARSGGSATVKVDTLKLDSLVDLVGEMVIAQSMVMQDQGIATLQSPPLTRNLAQLARITKELQRVAMSLRMVPIRATFVKMTRLVRDVSVKAGKSVELEMSGEDTELDRTIVEEISDPLVHMIRNAVDHGIEPAEKRLAAGKSPRGVIHLRAFHQGGNIVIEVEDDGGGLPRERILAKAVEKGLAPRDVELTDSEVFDLIFAPGFSTAEKVTDLSGRGVGMDVVRRNVEKLRGKVEIHSTRGKGSRFTVSLPLTLAIIDGMIVGIGRHRYIVPTLAVRETFRPTADMVSTVHGRAEIVNVRGKLIPLLRLHEYFGIESRAVQPTEGIVLVLESDRERRCVLVDDLLGKQEVVIKSLGETFKRSPSVAGAAILGDGRVGLILDVDALVGSKGSPRSLAA